MSTENYMNEIRQWLADPSKLEDLVVSASFIAGFEWPSVLIMTSNDYDDAQFYVRNMVMRAMWRLVWLKTDSINEVYESEFISTQPNELETEEDKLLPRTPLARSVRPHRQV